MSKDFVAPPHILVIFIVEEKYKQWWSQFKEPTKYIFMYSTCFLFVVGDNISEFRKSKRHKHAKRYKYFPKFYDFLSMESVCKLLSARKHFSISITVVFCYLISVWSLHPVLFMSTTRHLSTLQLFHRATSVDYSVPKQKPQTCSQCHEEKSLVKRGTRSLWYNWKES